MSEAKIKVYGTTWCPDCVRAKGVLAEHSVQYDWIDISNDEKARAYVERVNRGNRSVPTIVFPDGSMLVEPSNAELEKKLASLK
jgi:glutaredoxin-like protein